MKEVYLWKVDNKVVFHTDKNAALQIDGLSRAPDLTVTQTEFETAGGLVHIIDNVIVMGKTDQEKQIDDIIMQISEIDERLHNLDAEYLTPRILKGLYINDEYAVKSVNTHESKAAPLRKQRKKLQIIYRKKLAAYLKTSVQKL
jgi:hypothetical protein